MKVFGVTNQPIIDNEFHKVFSDFIRQPLNYKKQYLQRNIQHVFDGYSYEGQLDSLNQGSEDLVETMVVSEHFDATTYPSEFKDIQTCILPGLWKELDKVLMDLTDTYAVNIDWSCFEWMLSMNYYPPLLSAPKTPLRLTEHPDISLFTIFPFGVDECLEVESNGLWKSSPSKENMAFQTGYFAQWMFGISASNHRVAHAVDWNKERYSYAFFLIPKPGTLWLKNGREIPVEEYYEDYLTLF